MRLSISFTDLQFAILVGKEYNYRETPNYDTLEDKKDSSQHYVKTAKVSNNFISQNFC